MIEKETDMTEQEIQKLIDRAIVAREKNYSPYSHFGVGKKKVTKKFAKNLVYIIN